MKTNCGKKNITCIALDLDQTTLNHQGRLSEKNRQAIESAIRKGVQIVVASGRAISALPDDICSIRGIRYAVTSNGAAVYDIHTKECLQQNKMTEQSIEKILDYAKDLEVAFETFIDGKAYAQREYVEDPVSFGASPRAISYIQTTREPVDDIRSFLMDHKKCIESVDVVVKEENLKKELWKTFEENIPQVYVTSSVQQLLELSYEKSGKHSGIAYILEHLGLSRDGLAAFGDGDNDAELLKYAGIGIAVENASKACREAADVVTLSNDEDGVAYGIEKLLGL